MTYLSEMPKDPNKERTEVHLTKEEMKELKALAAKERRSVKNFTELIVINFLNEVRKTKKK